MIQVIASFLKVLNSESDPGQISLALCLSMVAGFAPFFSLSTLFMLLLGLCLRVNLSAFSLGWGLFALLAFFLDPLFHHVGWLLLNLPDLEGFWTRLYNLPAMRMTRFYNSVVMGSFVISLILFVPLFVFQWVMIRKYRTHFMSWIQKTRIAQILKGTKIYAAYRALS
ncbi:TIGR03546 family protein [Desulfobotulus sp.]|jgi:uncharacterized protein (TIGR03546 family)|uniref:TIGR03546 family protein n=1 Tax=Desulfobotulus sp. TaxID=1940337 RepID=UPI002A364B8E|nr:TIGR03546 family protein [Desulfobotulus sp.]MDY0162650.1 TIGR03546 family protein [Desulfobotulus sp.]